jgi:CheY-like chemotaxis protein
MIRKIWAAFFPPKMKLLETEEPEVLGYQWRILGALSGESLDEMKRKYKAERDQESATHICAKAPKSPQPQEDRALESQQPMKSILIVDDSKSARVAIRAAIETCTSFRVCGEATDGVEAIDKGPELNPDLVIMDLAMPEMNGVVAANLLKKKIPEIPIVLFTIYADELRNSLSSALGVTMVLSKVDGFAPLVDCLNGLLGSA